MVSDATETRGRKAVLHRAGQWAARVHKGTPFDVVVGIGLVTYGFVYLLVAAIAVRIAVTGQRGADTPYAALDALAETEVGEAMLWVTAFGLCALTLWQAFETVGRAAREGRTSPAGVVSSLEELALRIGVVVAGLVLIVLAVRSGYRGVRRRFVDDLRDGSPRMVIALGQAGLVGKGVTFAIIGGLMIWTALEGRLGPPVIQTVFRLVNLSPAGGILLVLKAIGLTAFGVYCLAWAANRRR